MEAKDIREKLFGKESMQYAGSSNNLALLYFDRGKYEKAELFYIEAQKTIKKVLGEEHRYYTVLVNNLALLYYKQGLVKKAEPLYVEVHQIRQKTVGKNHYDYASACNNLASLYGFQSEYDKAETLYLEAKRIKEEILGKKHPSYASTCDNLANLYVKQENYEKAEPLYIEAKAIREEVLGNQHPLYATSCKNLATFYRRTKKYITAEKLYIEAKKIRETILGRQNPDYANSCANLASFYKETKDYGKAKPLYQEATTIKINQLKLIFPILSETEKEQYLESFKNYVDDFTDFAVLYHNQELNQKNSKSLLLDELFNLHLFSKGIVFLSTQKIQKQILKSKDTTLTNLFEEWKQERTKYSKAIQLPLEERKQQNIELDKLEFHINEIERQFSKKSNLINTTLNEQVYELRTIQTALEKNEVLIDIIRYEKSNTDSEKEVAYVALLIPSKKAHSSGIKIVSLKEPKALESSEFFYYTNTTIFGLDNQDSYNFYWKQIDQLLKNTNPKRFDKVYLSLDGIYHKISLQSLYNTQTNTYLIEEETIEILSSSKDIINKNKKPLKLSLELNLSSKIKAKNQIQVYVFGYPTYDIRPDIKPKDFTKPTTQKVEKDSTSKPTFTSEMSEYTGLQRIIGHQKSVTVLEGTKTETSQINTLFKNKNIPTLLLQNEEANEQNIKKLQSPPILHIATHGFFIDKPSDSELQTLQDSEDRNLLKNPFLRSGLLLAGCQNPQLQGEDGILSAEEVMNLDLQNTELVVLSACETGLGDVEGGEGVYGLQRAFRQAGAKNVLMSLWKVDDTATQLLMNYFYTAILQGKSKREALQIAQLKLKKLYPTPYYWGAFLIVGE